MPGYLTPAPGGAPVPGSLIGGAPSADAVCSESGGLVVGGRLDGLRIYGWANMGALTGGPASALEDHAAGYTEFSCLGVSSQSRPHNTNAFPGAGATEGVFVAWPTLLTGDFDLQAKVSRGHPGSTNFYNNGFGLIAKRTSDADVNRDTRLALSRGGYSSAADRARLRAQVDATVYQGTPGPSTGSLTATSWMRLSRERDLIRAYHRTLSTDPWTELDAPGLHWDFAGAACEVGIGWGAHNEPQAWRLYDFSIVGLEA